jgi:hypothetical protein
MAGKRTPKVEEVRHCLCGCGAEVKGAGAALCPIRCRRRGPSSAPLLLPLVIEECYAAASSQLSAGAVSASS